MIDADRWRRIWGEPDLDAVREISADDLEVMAAVAAIEPRRYKGRDAAVRWLVELRERLQAEWTVTAVTALADDAVVVEGELDLVSRTTGATRQTFAVLMKLRDDKVRWIGTFITPDDARDAWERGVTPK